MFIDKQKRQNKKNVMSSIIRIIIGISLVLFCLTIILGMISKIDMAEKIAVFSYLSLIIAVFVYTTINFFTGK
jgi:hypothetical protein